MRQGRPSRDPSIRHTASPTVRLERRCRHVSIAPLHRTSFRPPPYGRRRAGRHTRRGIRSTVASLSPSAQPSRRTDGLGNPLRARNESLDYYVILAQSDSSILPSTPLIAWSCGSYNNRRNPRYTTPSLFARPSFFAVRLPDSQPTTCISQTHCHIPQPTRLP